MSGKDEFGPLVEAAKKARAHAYSPYSGVKIGAAVLTSSGSTFTIDAV